MQVKFGHVMIVGALFTLSGCGGSNGGASGSNLGSHYRTASLVIAPKNTNTNQATNKTTNNKQNTNNQNTGTPSNVLLSTGQNQNTNPTQYTNPLTGTTATAFITNANDSKALNITRVVRPTGELAKEVQEVVRLTNQLRAEKGLKPLVYDDNLSAFAQVRANEYEITVVKSRAMTKIRKLQSELAHQRIDGRPFYDGYIGNGGVSENLAAGRHNASQAVTAWKNSEGHYKNMMNQNHERIGVGVVHIPNSRWGYYWVQIFGSGTASFPYEFADVDGGTTNPEPLKQITVDGHTLPLEIFTQGTWQRMNGNAQGQFTGYNHTRFGAIKPNGSADTKLFYQGNQTADYAIPKSGTATYNGTALVVKDGKTDTNIDSRFTANFGTRKLNGTLSQKNTTLYTISADINGSGFASKKDASVQTQGAFFGAQAEELAGVFKDTKTNAKGVYGAKK